MRHFAMLDTETIVKLDDGIDTYEDALDAAPGNTVWVFTADTLAKLIAESTAALM